MTKEELHVVNFISRNISFEQQRLERLKDWAERITLDIVGLPQDNGYVQSRIEELTAQIIDCEHNLEQLILLRAEARAELVKQIDSALTDNCQKTVLIEHYGFGERYETIADKLHFTSRQIFNLHKKGLKALGIEMFSDCSVTIHLQNSADQ